MSKPLSKTNSINSSLDSTIIDLGIGILSPDVSVPSLYSHSLNCISDGCRRIFCVRRVL
ncbi:unnamed protein product [Meloidogyne enterolobii]|uniref:Uncharacterized protein n=1 Tax=Meloidogyne enterolobii TaxID=390850 RepID=A0ACB0ZN42_MELEN